MARVWTCRKCKVPVPRVKQRCPTCGRARPKPQVGHRRVLQEVPREEWERLYGTVCQICGAEPKNRALHRDHCHKSGVARGVLCFRCNVALKSWIDADWLRKAADYLERGAPEAPAE